MIPDFKTNAELPSCSHAQRLNWLLALDEDALRDVLAMAQRGAKSEAGHTEVHDATSEDWHMACCALADHLESLCNG